MRAATASAAVWLGLVPLGAAGEPSSDELQAQLDEARSQLESMGESLSALQTTLLAAEESLDATQGLISQTQTQIDETSAQLAERKELLAQMMSGSYKSGGDAFSSLSYILAAESAQDLVSRIYYLDKMSEQQASSIEEVKTLGEQLAAQKAQLEEQETAQQEELDATQVSVEEYQAQVAAAQDYIDSLDADVQEALAREAAEEAARAAAEAEEASKLAVAVTAVDQNKAMEETAQNASDAASDADDAAQDADTTQDAGTDDGSDSSDNSDASDGSDSSDSDSSQGTGASDSSVVTYARMQLGKPYIWGNYGPDAAGYDCCGLVATAYHMAGYSTPPYATNVPGIISVIKARGNWKDCNLSNYQQVLNVGDVIACSTGHVAIYSGGNMMVHANHAGGSVVESYVYACIGGGFGG